MNSTYRISKRKPNQTVNSDGYEVDLLAAPCTHPLQRKDAFNSTTCLIKQEWHSKRTAVSIVMPTVLRRADPLIVPDLHWMALHRLWLADGLERRADKREKNPRQHTVLLDTTRCFRQASHPVNIDFVHELHKKLRLHFDQKCLPAGFVPQP